MVTSQHQLQIIKERGEKEGEREGERGTISKRGERGERKEEETLGQERVVDGIEEEREREMKIERGDR